MLEQPRNSRAGPEESNRRRFGASALKVNGSIFAMLCQGQLVVKLPRHRVQALIEQGTGGPFSAGTGTPIKERVTVGFDEKTWAALASEALDHVASSQL